MAEARVLMVASSGGLADASPPGMTDVSAGGAAHRLARVSVDGSPLNPARCATSTVTWAPILRRPRRRRGRRDLGRLQPVGIQPQT
jgi:hypothetical protein